MAKSPIYSNQPGVKHTPRSGKPMASPSNVVTGAGPKGSGNWNPFGKGK